MTKVRLYKRTYREHLARAQRIKFCAFEVKTEVGELLYVIWLTGHRAQLPSEDVPP